MILYNVITTIVTVFALAACVVTLVFNVRETTHQRALYSALLRDVTLLKTFRVAQSQRLNQIDDLLDLTKADMDRLVRLSVTQPTTEADALAAFASQTRQILGGHLNQPMAGDDPILTGSGSAGSDPFEQTQPIDLVHGPLTSIRDCANANNVSTSTAAQQTGAGVKTVPTHKHTAMDGRTSKWIDDVLLDCR